MRNRFSQAVCSVLRRGNTAASHDRLQETIVKLTRKFPSVGKDLLRLFQQNDYMEWTSAFASLTTKCLQEVMEWEDLAQVCQNQPVSLVLTTSDLASRTASGRLSLTYLFLPGQGGAGGHTSTPGAGGRRRCPTICTGQ